jgi:predicted neuraminidase
MSVASPASRGETPRWVGWALAAAAMIGVAWHWTFALPPVVSVAFQPDSGPGAPPGAPPLPAPAATGEPFHAERFVAASETRHMHASSAYSAGEGQLTAFWYGGSAEGARDVSIYSSHFNIDSWSPARVVVERGAVEKALGRPIRKLGNATVYRHPDGRLWLLFVTVSVGGWAGSSLNLIESANGGKTWSAPRRLVTSPFLNLSTLVRTNAFRFADGSVGVPVYHEFIGKFGELLRLGDHGRVLSKTRLSTGRHALQPDVVVIDGQRAVLLLRNAGTPPRRLLRAATDDAGETWSDLRAVGMPNPDAALDALAIDGTRLLAVLNDSHDNRERLVLAISDDLGENWRTVASLADAGQGAPAGADGLHEYSYPWLQRSADGSYHVLFTWNRERIRHVQFNQAWLEQRAGRR